MGGPRRRLPGPQCARAPRLALRWVLVLAQVSRCASLGAVPKKATLGPGSFEPVEWAMYPRGPTLLDEVARTVDEAFQLRYERMEVRLGRRDLDYLLGGGRIHGGGDDDDDERRAPRDDGEVDVASVLGDAAMLPRGDGSADLSLLAVLELAARWPHGGVRALAATRTDAARLAALAAARSVGGLDARTLRDEAVRADDDPPHPGTLVVAVAPATTGATRRGPSTTAPDRGKTRDSANPVTQLQVVAARLQDANCALLCLNGKLRIPSPVTPGRAMKPLLMGDFKLVYAAEADALKVASDDSGIALYRRWPNPNYRLFARDADHFAFLGTSPKRPNLEQLRAVFAQARGPPR